MGESCMFPSGWNEHRIILVYEQIMNLLGCNNSAFAILQPSETCQKA